MLMYCFRPRLHTTHIGRFQETDISQLQEGTAMI